MKVLTKQRLVSLSIDELKKQLNVGEKEKVFFLRNPSSMCERKITAQGQEYFELPKDNLLFLVYEELNDFVLLGDDSDN